MVNFRYLKKNQLISSIVIQRKTVPTKNAYNLPNDSKLFF